MASGIADLEARLTLVEKRLAALEGRATEPGEYVPMEDLGARSDGFAAAASAQVGRILLIFGGAFFLRAITEAEYVPTALGLLLGAAYAIWWLVFAYRKAADPAQRTRASFLAGTSVLLALPLLHEAATTFAVLSGVQGVIAIAAYCALALVLAAVRDLKAVAWVVVAGGIGAAIASLVATQSALSVASFLLLLGLGTLWIVYWRDWIGLQWLGALGANIGVMALAGLALSGRWAINPKVPVMFATALLVTYLVSFTYQTHVRGKLVKMFEAAQTLAVGAIVLGVSAATVLGGHLAMPTVGIPSLALGVGGYALAITRETRSLRYRNFFYYTYFGLVFVITGTVLLLPFSWAAAIWSLLAMLVAWSSSRTGWVSLSLQCTILLIAASAVSGLLVVGFEAMVGDPADGWVSPGPIQVLVALATVACLFIPVPSAPSDGGQWRTCRRLSYWPSRPGMSAACLLRWSPSLSRDLAAGSRVSLIWPPCDRRCCRPQPLRWRSPVAIAAGPRRAISCIRYSCSSASSCSSRTFRSGIRAACLLPWASLGARCSWLRRCSSGKTRKPATSLSQAPGAP
jgi:hypothetical protein